MASSSYASANWRTEASDFKSSLASRKLDDDLSNSYRKRDDSHSLLENSQRPSLLSGSSRPKSRGSVIFEDDVSSLRLGSLDKLTRDGSDFGNDISSQRPKFMKSSLGSRRFGLQESDQIRSLGKDDDDDDLRLKLQLDTDMKHSSPPRYERAMHLGNIGDPISLDQLSARKGQTEYRSNLLGLQSSLTPRSEFGITSKKSQLRLPSGLDGADSFRDNASLRSSVRFSDEVDSRMRLDGDRKYPSDLKDGLSLLSPRVSRSRELEKLGSETKFRKMSDYEEKSLRLPKSLSKLRDEDRLDLNDVDKKSATLSRSSLTIREDPFAQSKSYRREGDVPRSSLQLRESSPRSHSRQEEDVLRSSLTPRESSSRLYGHKEEDVLRSSLQSRESSPRSYSRQEEDVLRSGLQPRESSSRLYSRLEEDVLRSGLQPRESSPRSYSRLEEDVLRSSLTPRESSPQLYSRLEEDVLRSGLQPRESSPRLYSRQEEDVLRSGLQPRESSSRSYSFKSRMDDDIDRFPESRYSGVGSGLDSTKYRASLGHQINGESHTALERPETSLSRLLTHSPCDTDLDLERTSKLKRNENEKPYGVQKSYSSPRASDATGNSSDLQAPSRSLRGMRPSDVERKLLIENDFNLRDKNAQLLTGAERKSVLNQDHRSSLLDSRLADRDESLERVGHSHRKLHDVEPGGLRRSTLLDDSIGDRKKSILLDSYNEIVNENRKSHESLGRNSEFGKKLLDDSIGDRKKSILLDSYNEIVNENRKSHESLGRNSEFGKKLLDDSIGDRKKSILLDSYNEIVNENRKSHESLGRNSEFGIKETRDSDERKRKEFARDVLLLAKRSLSSPGLRLTADVTGTKYRIVKHMIQTAGFSVAASKDADFSVIWNDSFVSLEKISALVSHQRINHFAGMGEIGNRSGLVKNIARLKSRFPNDYGFFPRSWVCPEDAEQFQAYCKDLKRKGKKKIYITKPITKSKETGVRLFADAEKIRVGDEIVIQEFLSQPLLINKRKFHLRCFVLVTSCDPLHIYLHSDGMACLAKEPYADASEMNLDQTSIHITDERNERCSLRQLTERLHQGRVDTAELWKAITDIIIKTLILAHPHLYQNYKLCRFTKPKEEESVCFEILGFDFLIDKDLNPWLIKVNQSPSFSVSDALDQEVKSGVLDDALQLVILSLKQSRPKVMTVELASKALSELNINTKDATWSKKDEKERTEEEMKKQEVVSILERIKMAAKTHRFGNNCGGYKQIFPPSDKNSLEKYLKLMESAHVFIPGPDDKRRQEVKQFLLQREKDRLLAVIRCGPTHEGSQRLHASKFVKIDIGEDLTTRTLKALNEMQITIPGKTEKAAAALINKVRESWKLYKPKMAEFWFVHLDMNKREKVINIVKNKVHGIAQSTWCTGDVENVGLYRIFLRLFNRLLSHHGRGLWDCFHSKRNSWEMIFTKTTDKITSTEMSCCRRVVQLCCDCLCIVYICTPQLQSCSYVGNKSEVQRMENREELKWRRIAQMK